MRYVVTRHAADRYVERTKKALNVIEARAKVQEAAERSVKLERHERVKGVWYLLDVVDKVILVVNVRKSPKVVITVYGVRK